ncbi:glycosyltransferase family 4 protein [Rhodopirellula bahusiensis]|nr:glycosyltransferase family 4 protein [Rhodopirellula bahusiensis]
MQICTSDAIYAWDPIDADNDSVSDSSTVESGVVSTIFQAGHYEDISRTKMRDGVNNYLDRERPDAIAVSGWSSADARFCLQWAQRNHCKTILMSETRRADGDRLWWKEALKSRIVRKFDAALVGSQSHADYLAELGLATDKIFRGYNVIDDDYFASSTQKVRDNTRQKTTTPFFLASNRFVEIKNLRRGIEAFAGAMRKESTRPWDLCLLGDGPLRESLIDRSRELGLKVVLGRPWDEPSLDAIGPSPLNTLPEKGRRGSGEKPSESQFDEPTVFFPGFQQIDALPEYYARAAALFHPATSEPWGLVINEAMASGLPILASRNGGAAETLIVQDENGLLFDPEDIQAMTLAMARFMQMPLETHEGWGQRSRELLEQRMPTSAFGKGLRKLLDSSELV